MYCSCFSIDLSAGAVGIQKTVHTERPCVVIRRSDPKKPVRSFPVTADVIRIKPSMVRIPSPFDLAYECGCPWKPLGQINFRDTPGIVIAILPVSTIALSTSPGNRVALSATPPLHRLSAAAVRLGALVFLLTCFHILIFTALLASAAHTTMSRAVTLTATHGRFDVAMDASRDGQSRLGQRPEKDAGLAVWNAVSTAIGFRPRVVRQVL